VHTGNTEKYLIDWELLTSLVEPMQLNLPTLNPKWHKQQHRFGTELLTSLVELMH
jgi:hypothetical protein